MNSALLRLFHREPLRGSTLAPWFNVSMNTDDSSDLTERRAARRLPEVDRDRCTGCGRCVAACDLHLLSLETVRWEKFATLNGPGQCTGCSLCAVRCPFDAITMTKPAGS